ncbi:MAG: class IV adenylate cyclase [Candidatus Bathyarchaeum sp.]|nr:MAG: class IV adenylate cyclase [Candidatus Bathyarchaeum sp.]
MRVDCILKIEAHHSFKYKMIELKARVRDHEFLRKKLSALGAQYVETFQQTDLYFKVPEGRLKLREVEGNHTAELIYYERENIPGPKRDNAFILEIKEPEDLKKILKKILTPLTVIEKVREIYKYQGTQIHMDTVKKLGKFIEFERRTSDDSKVAEKDRQILEKIMAKLKIDPNNFETLSYSDLPQT